MTKSKKPTAHPKPRPKPKPHGEPEPAATAKNREPGTQAHEWGGYVKTLPNDNSE